jgi:hypothetical protein
VAGKLNHLILLIFFRLAVQDAPIFIGRVWRNVDTSYPIGYPKKIYVDTKYPNLSCFFIKIEISPRLEIK